MGATQAVTLASLYAVSTSMVCMSSITAVLDCLQRWQLPCPSAVQYHPDNCQQLSPHAVIPIICRRPCPKGRGQAASYAATCLNLHVRTMH